MENCVKVNLNLLEFKTQTQKESSVLDLVGLEHQIPTLQKKIEEIQEFESQIQETKFQDWTVNGRGKIIDNKPVLEKCVETFERDAQPKWSSANKQNIKLHKIEKMPKIARQV